MKINRWVRDNMAAISACRPVLDADLTNRAKDIAGSLLMVAEPRGAVNTRNDTREPRSWRLSPRPAGWCSIRSRELARPAKLRTWKGSTIC
jgi:hypothetical protein